MKRALFRSAYWNEGGVTHRKERSCAALKPSSVSSGAENFCPSQIMLWPHRALCANVRACSIYCCVYDHAPIRVVWSPRFQICLIENIHPIDLQVRSLLLDKAECERLGELLMRETFELVIRLTVESDTNILLGGMFSGNKGSRNAPACTQDEVCCRAAGRK